MRISVRPNDPGYQSCVIGAGYRVYLNGAEVIKCITADEELGMVLCYALGADGQPYIDPECPDSLKEIEMYGAVSIVAPKEELK